MFENDDAQETTEVESPEAVETPSVDDGSQGGGEIKLNPAWNPLLEVVPSQLHSQVMPHLKEWDRNFQKKVEGLHEQYKPYKSYLDNGVTPDQINYGLSTLRAIEERPGDVLNAIRQYAKDNNITIEEAAQEVAEELEGNEGEEVGPYDAQLAELQKQQEVIAQFLVQQKQTEESAAEDARLSQELADLQKEHGDFDEEWVLTKVVNNPDMSLADAVKSYNEFVTGIIASQRKPGPRVMSGGGGAPSNQQSVREMSSKDRVAYMASMLEAAKRNSQ